MELTEAIEKTRVDKVQLIRGPRPRQFGSLVLTGHHLIFAPDVEGNGVKSEEKSEFWLLHRAVDRVVVDNNTTPDQPVVLHLKCKNFLICSFIIKSNSDAQAVARSIDRLSNLSNIDFEYPFYHPKTFDALDNGWTAFDISQIYANLLLVCQDRWRISHVNEKFNVCPSYPKLLIVPQGIGDDFLRISATYRDGSRFPVLSYYHPDTKSCIIRCGQPLVSPTNRRCKEDEIILNSLLSNQGKGVIFDTRTESVATAARAKGGGKEQRYHYSQWRYVHADLPQKRDFKDSLVKLIDACIDYGHTEKWLYKLATSQWLQYVSDALTAAGTIAQWVHCTDHETPVVVHGGEGTDTTLLVTSLSQLLLNVDSRTVRGFQSLIEAEWISAGHPFSLRCAHSAFAQGSLTGPHESPIFICFLDCVWQLMRQYPSVFEFNQEFLILIAEHCYASEFGSFLGNNEKEKSEHNVKDRSASLWSYVNHPKILSDYMNCLYAPYDSVLWPSVAAPSIVLWERFYLRWQRNWTKTDLIYDELSEWKRKEKDLRAKLLSRSMSEKKNSTTASITKESINNLEQRMSEAVIN